MVKELFGEGDKVSMMRLVMFFVVVDIMGVWTTLCIQQGRFMDMPPEAIAMIGTVIAGKVGQKFAERKNGNGIMISGPVVKPLNDQSKQ